MFYVIEEKNLNKIKKDYKSGLTYKALIEKYNITRNELISIIRKNKWKRKSNKSISHKNNKNAVGNKGGRAPKGNKNAVVTGAYENIFDTVLTEEEKALYKRTMEDKRTVIEKEINLLEIREFRMMSRIAELKNKASEMSIVKITKKVGDKEGTTTEVESIIAQIQRIEVALTQVQEAKRRYVETLNKMDNPQSNNENSNDININVNSTTTSNPLLESINRQLGGGSL